MYVDGMDIHWAGGRTQPPPDTPACGFDNSLCKSKWFLFVFFSLFSIVQCHSHGNDRTIVISGKLISRQDGRCRFVTRTDTKFLSSLHCMCLVISKFHRSSERSYYIFHFQNIPSSLPRFEIVFFFFSYGGIKKRPAFFNVP